MRFSDYIEQSFSNLRKKKLRTFLTTFGVVIGIGALVCMFAFGKGMQKNMTEGFNKLELFNYLGVFQRSENNKSNESTQDPNSQNEADRRKRLLDDDFIIELTKIEGVEWAFPEIRFLAMIRYQEEEEFSLIQVLPARICQSGIVNFRAGTYYTSDEEYSLIISDSLLHRMDIKKPEEAIGKKIEVSTLAIDFSLDNIPNILSFLRGQGLPFSRQSYTFTIVGVTERMGMGGPTLIRSGVCIPYGTSKKMKKLPVTSISDLFVSTQQTQGYSAIGIKLTSPKYVEPVRKRMEEMGFNTFSLTDQIEEIKTVFIFMDLFLFAVGMIAIVVASLGIINTMVMSILERYKEIGIMKAVGASNKDVKKIFLFESGVIGFMGGIFGLTLGWIVSVIINVVINSIAVREGAPNMNYFSFPWWLCLGSIAFSVLISLIAGIYPTVRAAKIDPVIALRHD
ncbi:MAG: ABC transporter permease [Sedimentisphaerales bacterium]|nr:ABC transporter permease [Sedimentisphaerales bacterium]